MARLAPWLAILALVVVAPVAGWLIAQAPPGESPPSAEGQASNPDPQVAAHVAPTATATQGRPAPRPAPTEPQQELSQWTTMSAAVEESRRSGKPVLIDFNAEWCPPCQSMKRELFDNPALDQTVRASVIPVSIVDRRREDGRNSAEVEELQRRYKINAFPTLVVYSPTRDQHVSMRGYAGAQGTLGWITNTAKSLR